MEKMKGYIVEYQKIYLEKQKIENKPASIYIIGIAYFLMITLATYLFGMLFDVLYNINYLIVMFDVIVFSSYAVYKYLIARHYKEVTKEEHSIWMINSLNYLYVLTMMTTATAFLSFSVFFRYVSIIISILFAVIAIISAMTYRFTEKRCDKIVLPNTFNTLLNGFFIAVLFYALILVLHIENVPLSFAAILPVMLVCIVIKRYIEKRFVVRVKRVAIVGLGLFLILLSFPFTSAFNYVSFYRGEFTTRVAYQELDDPVAVLPEELNGEVIFHENQLIIASEHKINFLNDNFEVVKSMNNIFVTVYSQGDGLYANKRNINNPTVTDLYKYDGTEFVFVDSYFLNDLYDKVYLDDNGNQYFMSFDGYTYHNTDGQGLKLQESDGLDKYEIVASTEDFIAFYNDRVFMATQYTYAEEARGTVYNRIAYHNDHLVFTYTPTYVARNRNIVDPEDRTEIIYYLVDMDDYAASNGDYDATVQLYKLFRIDELHYYNDNYYLFGHVSYINGTDVYRMYVYNNEGELQKEVVVDDDSVTMNDEYIIYGSDQLKVYELNSDTNIRYSLVTGYGLFFFTMAIVSAFSIKDIHLNPKRNKKFTI